MLTLEIPAREYYNQKSNTFFETRKFTLTLEHSLVSVSKWESKYQKPFLSKERQSLEEVMDYIKFMTITQNVPEDVYLNLTPDEIQKINDYISSPMSATKFWKNENGGGSRETITSELIYYWMIALNIPFECQKWHLNRLLTLIRICNIKNSPKKKMSKSELANRNHQLNAARRAALGTNG